MVIAEKSLNKININTAELDKLTTLRGIGPSLAQRIVDYRKMEGPFTSLEDLKQVKGIGKKLFAGIQGNITNELEEVNLEQLEIEETISSSAQTSELAQKKLEDEGRVEDSIMYLHSLPDSYNEDKLVLQIKNPKTAHLYWEYTRDKIKEATFKAGHNDFTEVDLFLKVYNLTTGEERLINITLENDSWYLNNLVPDHNYKVELGVVNQKGEFYSVIESNHVTMPRNNVSDELDQKWMTVKEKQKAIYLLSGCEVPMEEGVSSIDLVKELEKSTELSDLISGLDNNESSIELLSSVEFLGSSFQE
ncbi:hypothetical protein JCM16358_05540 [Halanaerocella petrolearia]